MHTLEDDRQEVVQRHQEGVGPLAGEVRREGRILIGRRDEGQDEPVPPLSLALQLRGLPLEKLMRLLQAAFLETGANDRNARFVFSGSQPDAVIGFCFAGCPPEWC